jgi:flagellar hook-length control protein FliK
METPIGMGLARQSLETSVLRGLSIVSTVQVGFTPVAAGKGVIAGVAAGAAASMAGGEAGDDASPLGFLDALMDTLTQNLGLPTPGQTTDQPQNGAQPTTTATLGVPVISPELAIQSSGQPLTLPEEAPKLLQDLVAALKAMDQASQAGEPVDPALEKKLADIADELAGLLGITLPTQAQVDPAIAAAATGGAIPNEAITPSQPGAPQVEPDLPAAQPVVSAPTNPDDLAADFAAAVKAVTGPLLPPTDTDAKTAANAAPPAGDTADAPPAPAQQPDSQLAKLIEKLDLVATKLESKSPVASEKLQKLAEALAATAAASGAAAADLDANLDEADIAALSTAKPETKATPAPQIFTQPVLPTPPVAVKAATAETTATNAGAIEPAKGETSEEPSEVRLSPDKPATEKPVDKDAKVTDRKEFGQHLAEARAERIADKAQDQQAQNPATPVRTETGVVAPKTVHAAYQAPVQQVNLPQVAFEVVRQFNQGASRFQIRLDPPEMGRIDVNLKIDADGKVNARMTVERVETLDLMQRDQRHLERALAQAGLDSSKTTLEFSLRQNPSGREGQNPQQQQQNQSGGSPFARSNTGTEDIPDIVSTQYRGSASLSGVNLFV